MHKYKPQQNQDYRCSTVETHHIGSLPDLRSSIESTPMKPPPTERTIDNWKEATFALDADEIVQYQFRQEKNGVKSVSGSNIMPTNFNRIAGGGNEYVIERLPNGRARVLLHKNFQGEFSLQTKNGGYTFSSIGVEKTKPVQQNEARIPATSNTLPYKIGNRSGMYTFGPSTTAIEDEYAKISRVDGEYVIQLKPGGKSLELQVGNSYQMVSAMSSKEAAEKPDSLRTKMVTLQKKLQLELQKQDKELSEIQSKLLEYASLPDKEAEAAIEASATDLQSRLDAILQSMKQLESELQKVSTALEQADEALQAREEEFADLLAKK